MASSLLDKSLDELSRQEKASPSRRGSGARGGRGVGAGIRSTSGNAGRAAPYSKRPSRVDADADSWQHDLFHTNKLDYGDDPSSAGEPGSSGRANFDNGPRSTRLKITNLHYEVSEQELRALFEQIGPLAAPAGGREQSNPAIKYDASGRSEGEATVTYESEADAARAKEVFNNALAKGERISLAYDFTVPRRPRRQEGDVLIKGIPKTGLSGAGNPLLSRLQPAPASAKRDTFSTSNERGSSQQNGRGRGIVDRGGPANRSRGGAAPARGRGTGRPARDRASKTVEDLDKELEEFMAGNSTAETPVTEDTEMS